MDKAAVVAGASRGPGSVFARVLAEARLEEVVPRGSSQPPEY